MAQRLRVRTINTVGFVDKGDDPKAAITFWKRETPVEEWSKRIVQRDGQWCVTTMDGTRTLGCHDTPEAARAQLAAVEANKKRRDGGMKGFLKALGEAVGMAPDNIDALLDNDTTLTPTPTDTGGDMEKVEDLQDQLAKAEKRAEDAEARLAELEKDGQEQDVLKDVPPAVADRFTKLEQRAQAAEEALAKVNEDKEKERFIAKAATLSHLPNVNPDDLGPVLRKAFQGLDQEEQDQLWKVLAAANEVAQSTVLMEELGVDDRGGDGTARAQVYDKAQDYIKAHPGTSFQVARGKVLRANPDLRRQYDNETANVED